MIAVDAAHWPAPLGYLYTGILDNWLASLCWAVPAFFFGKWFEKRQQGRHEDLKATMADHHAALHRKLDAQHREHLACLDEHAKALHSRLTEIHSSVKAAAEPPAPRKPAPTGTRARKSTPPSTKETP